MSHSHPAGGAVVDATGAGVDQQPTRRGGVIADVACILGVYAALGVAGGVAWWLLVDPAMFTKAANGRLSMGEVQLSRRFDVDGWFVVVAALCGLLSGGVLTWWRSRDFLLTSGLLVVGSGVSAVVMTLVGRALGPADPETLVAQLAVRDRVPAQLEVTAAVCYLVWPIAVLVGALFVLWSPPTEPLSKQTEDDGASLA